MRGRVMWYVLTRDAVRDCIEALRGRRIHPYFPAYLHLRQRAAARGSTTGIRPRWPELSPFLQVGGAPPERPHFRPFTESKGAVDHEWLNPNLAGSYAPSSLRAGQPPLQVVEIGPPPGTFTLRPKHWELARRHLLHGEKLPLMPLAGFLLRDFAFETDDAPPGSADLEAAFAQTFGYTDRSGPQELDYLYDREPTADASWFELFQGTAP